MSDPNSVDAASKKGGREEMNRRRSARKIAAEREARRKRLLSVLGAALLALVAIGALVWAINRQRGVELVAGAPLPEGVALDGRTMGDPAAKVHVVEYGDFQCPHCANFHKTVEKQLVDTYVKSGKATFEFRDYPFIGPESLAAAAAADCAQDQGKFWVFHNLLFANQKPENSGGFTPDRLKAMGAKAGLDTATFDQCVDDGTHAAAAKQAQADAQAKGVDSTPTVFINDAEVLYTWEAMQAAIEKALAGS